MFVRKKKNPSGIVSAQIIDKSAGSYKMVKAIGSSSDPNEIAGENLTTKEVVVDGLDYSTTYYWYVVARYEGDKVANSPTWSFKTRAENEE